MLKKTVLTFAFLTILTTFYGFNAQFSAPATDDALNALAEMHHSLLPEGSYVISAYDNLIRNISEEEGHDSPTTNRASRPTSPRAAGPAA